MYPQTNSNNIFKKRLLALAVLIVVLLVGYAVYGVIKDSTFRVINTNPPVSDVASVAPFFNIQFNRNLKVNGLKVTANPNIITSYRVSGSFIYIDLQVPLNTNTKYTISVSGIVDSEDQKLANQLFSFTPQYVPPQDLSSAQRQALLKQQVNYNQQHNNPILEYLPHTTPDFTLNYTYTKVNNKQQLVLIAQLFIPQAQANNITATANQEEQEVISYIQSLNLNPNNYQIQYKDVL